MSQTEKDRENRCRYTLNLAKRHTETHSHSSLQVSAADFFCIYSIGIEICWISAYGGAAAAAVDAVDAAAAASIEKPGCVYWFGMVSQNAVALPLLLQ